jgi:hypothetical protein
MAEHVALEKAAAAKQLDIPLATESVVHLVYESRTAAEKASEEIGLGGAVHGHTFDGMDVWMPGEDHEEFVDTYMDLSEAASEDVARTASTSKTPDTHKGADAESGDMAQEATGDGGGDDATGGGDSTDDGDGLTLKDLREDISSLTEDFEAVKEAVETEKQDEQEAAATLADAHGMEPGDIIDVLTLAEGKDLDAVLDAIDSIDAGGEAMEAESDEDEEDTEKETAEKRADGANLGKGGDATGTAQKGVTDDGGATSGTPSYRELAKQAEEAE